MVRSSTNVRRFISVIAATLASGLLVAGASTARAGLVGLWRLDQTAGTVAPNSASGGTDGTLYNGATVANGPTWTYNADRGLILSFDGGDDFVDAGTIPALGLTDDFTWTFWARANQGPNSEVILGNRKDAANTDAGGWVKFTGANFEFRGTVPTTIHNNLNYPDIPSGGPWIHHAVVKTGNQLQYYRDGVPDVSMTITAQTVSQPFYFGGDKYTERYNVWLDDVAIFDQALSQSQVQTIMGGDFSAFGAASPTGMSDAFDGTSLDTTKWAVFDRGLQYTGDSGYDPPSVGGGTLTLGGTTNHTYWGGKSVRSTDAFQVPEGGEVKFDVDRVSLTGSGTAYRSSMWMYADSTHFVHFAQNTENGWQYNYNDGTDPSVRVGGGIDLGQSSALDSDHGLRKMALVNDGAYVKIFIDGRWVGSQAASFDQFQVMLTGQARYAGDTVQAEFDNANVSTRMYSIGIYDNFNSGTIDPAKWTVIPKGLENQGVQGSMTATIENGELLIQGSTGAQYWYGLTLQNHRTFGSNDRVTFAVDRDAMTLSGSGARGRSGLWVWADDDHFLFFGQSIGTNEYGWEYNYADGAGVGEPDGYGVNIPALDGLDTDGGSHELRVFVHPDGSGNLVIDMFLDGDDPVATQTLNNWGGLSYQFMLSAMPRASGDSILVAFDNVQMRVPEPSTWLLLALGGLALALLRRRRSIG